MNIREFAARCGVSPSSVSKILNRSQKESQASSETYDRIRRMAIELGYRPNYAVRILHTRKSNCLGVIIVPRRFSIPQPLSGAFQMRL